MWDRLAKRENAGICDLYFFSETLMFFFNQTEGGAQRHRIAQNPEPRTLTPEP